MRFLPFDKTQDNFHSAEIAVFPFNFLGSKTPSVKKTAAKTVKTAKTLDLNPRVGVGKTLGGWTEGSARRKVDSAKWIVKIKLRGPAGAPPLAG